MLRSLLLLLLLFSSSNALQSAQEEKIHDPYTWLEQEDSPLFQEWVEGQNLKYKKAFPQDELREKISQQLMQTLDFDAMSVPYKLGKQFFFIGRLKEQVQPALYRMDEKKNWNCVINPTEFCPEGTASLVGYRIHDERFLVAYGISRAGSDWQEWRIRDLRTGKDFSECLTKIKFAPVCWDKDGDGLFYFGFQDDLNSSLNVNHLYYHKIGTGQEQDLLLLSNNEKNVRFFSPKLALEGHYLVVHKRKGTHHCNGILLGNLQNTPYTFVDLIPMEKANYAYFGCHEGRLFFTTDDQAPFGRIISIDPLHPEPAHWQEHVAEEDVILDHAAFAGNKIVVSYLKDAHSQLKIFNLQGKLEHEIALPGIGTAGSGWRNTLVKGSAEDLEFYFPFTSYTQPMVIFKCHAETGVKEVLAAPELNWKPDDFETEQFFYPSKDGTLIPLFLVHKKGFKKTGSQPTLLYGYGGFGISMTPNFDPKIVSWIESGGIYAVANIRGGGEYGEQWHQAGMLHKKQNSFDDFIAAAEWLCQQGYTNSSKLAINGRSNGGLLVAACLVQRPDLFKAALVDVGVLDMLKFHKYTVGSSWMVEYGDPENPKDLPILLSYSPYHQVKTANYPATLITTADHDNRVVPLHSYKFTAALQASQKGKSPIVLKIYENAGHGAGKSLNQRIEEDTDHLYFLMQQLK